MQDRLLEMKNLYDMRYSTLKESIQETYSKIMNDELINTMKKDPISSEFLS